MGLFLRDLAFLAILLSGPTFPNDDFESYIDGAQLNALNGGGHWTGSYVDRHGLTGIQQYDDIESYTDGVALNGLNAAGWPGAYVDTLNFTGLKASDDLESYSDGAALNGLNIGTGWAGAFVDR
jgi:hypothetical protein